MKDYIFTLKMYDSINAANVVLTIDRTIVEQLWNLFCGKYENIEVGYTGDSDDEIKDRLSDLTELVTNLIFENLLLFKNDPNGYAIGEQSLMVENKYETFITYFAYVLKIISAKGLDELHPKFLEKIDAYLTEKGFYNETHPTNYIYFVNDALVNIKDFGKRNFGADIKYGMDYHHVVDNSLLLKLILEIDDSESPTILKYETTGSSDIKYEEILKELEATPIAPVKKVRAIKTKTAKRITKKVVKKSVKKTVKKSAKKKNVVKAAAKSQRKKAVVKKAVKSVKKKVVKKSVPKKKTKK